MKTINLKSFYMVCKEFSNDHFLIKKYLKHHADSSVKIKKVEVDTLISFGSLIRLEKIDLNLLRGFHFGYSIPQISKEFDLLRISDDLILNIEFKSKLTDKSLEQLGKNNYYLSSVSKKKRLFMYVSENDVIYELIDGEYFEVDGSKLRDCIINQKGPFKEDLDTIFKVSNFLVSPLNSTEKFLNGNYFLTDNQSEVKKSIYKCFEDGVQFIGLEAKAGTGKTLLLYDMAIDLTKKGFKVLVIHCAQLCSGHGILELRTPGLTICSAKNSKHIELVQLQSYDFLFLDEVHRFFSVQLQRVIDGVLGSKVKLVFSLDDEQKLGLRENYFKNSEKIEKLTKENHFKLKGKVRTNKIVSSFIVSLFDLSKSGNTYNYSNIDVVYGEDEERSMELIDEYVSQGYEYLNLTPSVKNYSTLDRFNFGLTSHEVIGQEFNKVVTYINNFFYYKENRLEYKQGPNPDHILTRLLYQNLTRVRENLCIVVIGNKEVFETIVRTIFNEK